MRSAGNTICKYHAIMPTLSTCTHATNQKHIVPSRSKPQNNIRTKLLRPGDARNPRGAETFGVQLSPGICEIGAVCADGCGWQGGATGNEK